MTTLQDIEKELATGQIPPHRLAEFKDWLAAESSTLMDRQLELQLRYADFYEVHKPDKTDKGVLQSWLRTAQGMEGLTLETRQKKIKVLREAISSHLRVASDQAHNLY